MSWPLVAGTLLLLLVTLLWRRPATRRTPAAPRSDPAVEALRQLAASLDSTEAPDWETLVGNARASAAANHRDFPVWEHFLAVFHGVRHLRRGASPEVESAVAALNLSRVPCELLELLVEKLLQRQRWDLAEPVVRNMLARPEGALAGRYLLLQVQGQQSCAGPDAVMNHARRILPERYRVDSLLGVGGMGYVVKAALGGTPDGSERTLAIKVLSPLYSYNQDYTRRFQREVETTQLLSHPGIVRVLEVHLDQFPYIVMEYVPGVVLRQLLREQRVLPAGRALGYIRQLADALAHAHDRGVVHRDVKPENIIVGPEHKLTLIDFGLAKASELASMTMPGQTMVSFPYTGPEQAESASTVDLRADIYSFGVIATELLTGTAPAGAGAPAALPAELPAGFATFIEECLKAEPETRPVSLHPVKDLLAKQV